MVTTRRDLRIYIAGPIQGNSLLESFANIDNGEKWQAKVFQLGFSPFPVFSDYSFLMKVRPVPHIQEVYNYSLTWLAAADAVLLIDGWNKSRGVKGEISEAERRNIPIFDDIGELCKWADFKILPVDNSVDAILARSDD